MKALLMGSEVNSDEGKLRMEQLMPPQHSELPL